MRVEAVEDQGEEEGEDPQQVDHVQEGEQELQLEKISALKNCILATFFGETVKRMMYSRVNQTTKVVSAIWKKSLSSCWLSSSVCCEINSSKIKSESCPYAVWLNKGNDQKHDSTFVFPRKRPNPGRGPRDVWLKTILLLSLLHPSTVSSLHFSFLP